jgi:amino acid adenylation domain-containing protein
LVSEQAAHHPDALALIHGRSRMTYREMNRRANLLARYLRSAGVGRESVVALWLRRSPWIAVAALAALKAQAAYLPLDPEHPNERLLYMVRDSGAKVVLTESALAERTRGAQCPTVVLDRICDDVARYHDEDLGLESNPDDLAYLIYTSGSTGTPKGVEITHGNLSNLVSWHNRAYAVTRGDRASHLAGLGFDASVWETWPYLAAGASLSLADYQTLISPEKLRAWIIDGEITIGFIPTPMAERLLALDWPSDTKLRTLLTGGDTLHLHPAPGLPFTLVNNYGPTECAVVSTFGVVPPSPSTSLPPIGAPIDNAEVYILDSRMQPVPRGTAGELYIGGAGVGRGYRNRPELTADCFVPSPFSPQERLYKTGDMGCCLPDGQIAFLGRTDNQVKIRGYRIELEEIAAVLNTHPRIIVSALALHGKDGGEKQLVAYVVAAAKPSVREMQDYLAARLPDYMVPSVFVHLESLPLTVNGKVDRAALPAPNAENMLTERTVAPSTNTEIKLAIVISNLLKVTEIGVDDDFFMLGGHSLLGTQLIARIRESFRVEMPLLVLFEQPTVRGLAAEIERLQCVADHAKAA